ncbi:MAG: ribbon-helix-helix protein, CopG family [Clostridia bacterium]|nr:ribbon-helix-helix protein, CopG family [Clostridia bacterium]
MGEQRRDYKKELENEKKIIKRYTVKVPLYMAEAFDEKLKKENKTYTQVLREAIEKYLKKT